MSILILILIGWIVLPVVALMLPPLPEITIRLQIPTVDITITATPDFVEPGVPTGFTLTYVSDFEIGVSWTKGTPASPSPPGTASTVVNTLIRIRWGEAPTSRTDGYEVYYGDGSNFSDTTVDLTSLTQIPYYRAWTETVFYDAGGDIISTVWDDVGTTEEANFMSLSWLFMGLLVIALGLTAVMFVTKKAMLGFPSAMFWAIFGAYCFTQSTTPWGDIYYYLFFASAFGMVVFTMLAAYGLRERRDTLADEGMEKGGGGYFDEGREKGDDLFSIEDASKPSKRTQDLRDRAKDRRTG